jgi:murein DD-endopeptidase MepM/ murein hydrolase activator NlpD
MNHTLRSLTPSAVRLVVLFGVAAAVLVIAAFSPSDEAFGSPGDARALPGPVDTVLVPQYPQNYFRSPLDIPLHLSGNFGELRTNHFHAGIDIKTNQQEGLKVYAVADGHVSRIKVSPVGYGYALYLDHPNGYTTVYGHLQRYNERILEYVKREQYDGKTFAVDLFPSPEDLPVSGGEVIGLSGNSGGSGGPHLHFEVRETVSEKVLNPLLFGFRFADKIPPSVSRVWIVPMSDSTRIGGGKVPVSYETVAGSGAMKLNVKSPPTVFGDVGFAIHSSDQLNGNANRCGIYRIELFVDGLQVYGQRMDRLDFTTNRAMNAHTIYERFKKDRSQLHGSYRLPGNPLDIYDNLVNDGIITFSDGKLHDVEYRVYDFEGNKSVVKFQVQAATSQGTSKPVAKDRLAYFDWERDNAWEEEDIRIRIPAYSLYESVDFTLSRSRRIAQAVSQTYHVISPYEPLHSEFTISIRADQVKEKYRDKLIVARYDQEKDRIYSEGGVFEDGFVTAKSMYLGYFAVMVDTVPPSVGVIDFAPAMKGRSSFSMRIHDGLSGIREFYPTIDGEWVLMEYDAKNNRLTCHYDPKRMSRGSHQFELKVTDGAGNEKKYKSAFTW